MDATPRVWRSARSHRCLLYAGQARIDALDGLIGLIDFDRDDEFEFVVGHLLIAYFIDVHYSDSEWPAIRCEPSSQCNPLQSVLTYPLKVLSRRWEIAIVVEFWKVGATSSGTIPLCTDDICSHVLSDWVPSLPASVGS